MIIKAFIIKKYQGHPIKEVFLDFDPFVFLPFSKIDSISLNKSFWKGYSLKIITNNKTINLITTAALSVIDKKDIYNEIKKKLKSIKQQT